MIVAVKCTFTCSGLWVYSSRKIEILHIPYTFLCGVLCFAAPDVYAVVRCESDTIRTRVFKAEGNPEFNLRTLFYRRYPSTHISIEVWHDHIPSRIDTQIICTRNPSQRLVVCSYGVEVFCGIRCSAGLNSRRWSLRGTGVMWLIYEVAAPPQDTGGASTLRRPPVSASQTCDSVLLLTL